MIFGLLLLLFVIAVTFLRIILELLCPRLRPDAVWVVAFSITFIVALVVWAVAYSRGLI